jgi:hypothetical protein
MDKAHVQLHGRQRFHIVAERRGGVQSAHAGHFARAGLAVAHGTDPAIAFHQFFCLFAYFLHAGESSLAVVAAFV